MLKVIIILLEVIIILLEVIINLLKVIIILLEMVTNLASVCSGGVKVGAGVLKVGAEVVKVGAGVVKVGAEMVKVGAAVAVCRRGGASATFDVLNKYFTISGMPVAPSQYWNSVHGLAPGEASQDAEGLQTMRTLARNMAFLVKSIALGKQQYGIPQKEEWTKTSFRR